MGVSFLGGMSDKEGRERVNRARGGWAEVASSVFGSVSSPSGPLNGSFWTLVYLHMDQNMPPYGPKYVSVWLKACLCVFTHPAPKYSLMFLLCPRLSFSVSQSG